MDLIKVLRLRPTVTSIEDRLSYVVVQETGYKGAISDVRLEVYVENVTIQSNDPTATSTSGDEFELKFIEITKVSTGQAPTAEPVKRYSNINGQFGDTRTAAMQYIIEDFITRNAYSILMNRKSYSYTEAEKQAPTYYKIVQDPWKDEPPLIRNYSNDPYFLNNGVELKVEWKSTGSSVVDGTEFSNSDGSESYSKSLSMPGKTPSVPFIQDEQDIEYAKSEKKKISKTIIGSDKSTGSSVYYTISSNDIKIAGTGSLDASVVRDNFTGDVLDVDIINKFVDIWKKKVPNYNLKICQPSYYPSLVDLEFKSPLQSVSAGTPSNDNQSTQSNDPNEVKFKLSIVYDKNVTIKADADVPDIKIYVGEPPKDGEFLFDEDEFDDLSLLDPEYIEVPFDAEQESPSDLGEPPLIISEEEANRNISNELVNVSFNGPIPNIPKSPSHTAKQGYNILDSKWIGNLLVSAKAHIGHQTSDIPGTGSESCGFKCNLGSLACASAVSIIFYRAFGVNMKNGKTVNDAKDINDFGTRGTAELSGWLDNNNLYKKRDNWRNAQPGDIINTSRGSAAGHVGIVIDQKDADGSYAIVSNSSSGFNDGGSTVRAIKLNYSVKKWEKVAKRNPTKTFAVQYVGPRLSA